MITRRKNGRRHFPSETALSACPEGMHPYQTLGEIQFFFDGIEGGRERKSGNLKEMLLCEGTKRYERSLDLDTAICLCSNC